MKYLLPIGFLIIGVSIGYFIGVNRPDGKRIDNSPITDSNSLQSVIDTVIKTEYIEVPIAIEEETLTDSVLVDSSNVIQLDTLSEQFLSKPKDSSTLNSDELSINKDIRIASKKLTIIQLTRGGEDKDSLVKSILEINEVNTTSIIVEFWESPLNYSGYKLSKSKLILYDLSPQFDYSLYKKGQYYYLSLQSVFYKMEETNEFLPYLQIDKIDG